LGADDVAFFGNGGKTFRPEPPWRSEATRNPVFTQRKKCGPPNRKYLSPRNQGNHFCV